MPKGGGGPLIMGNPRGGIPGGPLGGPRGGKCCIWGGPPRLKKSLVISTGGIGRAGEEGKQFDRNDFILWAMVLMVKAKYKQICLNK